MNRNETYTSYMHRLCEMVLSQEDSVSRHNWMYEDGVLLEGMLQAEALTADERIFPFVKQYIDCFVTEDGHIPRIEKRPSSVDCLNNAKLILEVYHRTGEAGYRKALEYIYAYIQKHPRLSGTTAFAHKAIYADQMWLDGLYMLQPLYARMIPEFGREDDYQDVANQFSYIYQFTYDEETGLFYHAYDHTKHMFWSDNKTGRSPHFWGRAMGWLGMAAVDTLEAVPLKYEKQRAVILEVLQKLADGVVRWQNEKGVWYQITDQGTRTGNYMEASCSSMFANFLLKAVRDGYLPKSYEQYAKSAMEGIFKEFMSEDENGLLHINNVCLVAGLGPEKRPERDGTFAYYISEPVVKDDNKARGPLLQALVQLAADELHK